ncbi:MAG TPA: hypothetical protein VNF50_07795 [Acidimicrobiales bacterium]|nr:hypothetical protein [Acidimicrobiales bacterium]
MRRIITWHELTVADAQRAVYEGRPLVSAVLASAYPGRSLDGMTVMPVSQVEAMTLSQMSPAQSSIGNSRTMIWFIAAIIAAALVYVTALERNWDTDRRPDPVPPC